MKVRCVFSIESPHRGGSNEYTQHTIFSIKKKITLNFSKSAAMESFPRDSRTSSKQPGYTSHQSLSIEVLLYSPLSSQLVHLILYVPELVVL